MRIWKIVLILLLCVFGGDVSGGWNIPLRKAKTTEAVSIQESVPSKRRAFSPEVPTPPDPAPSPPLPTPINPNPTLIIADVSADVGAMVEIVPQTNCDTVKYFQIDRGLTVVPNKYLNTSTDFLCFGLTPGKYRIAAYSAYAGEPTDPVIFTITILGQAPRPPPGPTPDPTPNPPAPVTATNLWIVTIDDVTARQPATAAILTDPFWFTLTKPKFQFIKVDLNSSGVKTKYAAVLKLNGGQPAIAIFNADTGTWLNQDAADTKLPATVDGLKTLLKKYGGQL